MFISDISKQFEQNLGYRRHLKKQKSYLYFSSQWLTAYA